MRMVTRRGFLGSGGSLAVISLVAACGGRAAPPSVVPTSPPPLPTTSPAPTQARPTTSTPATTVVAQSTIAPRPTNPPAATAVPAASPSAAPTVSTAAVSPVSVSSNGLTLTTAALNGTALTAWAWQSPSADADRFIVDQSAAWGKANGGSVAYTVLPTASFDQKLGAAIAAKTVPDVLMTSNALYYQGLNLLVDLTDQYNRLNQLAGGFYQSFRPGIQLDAKTWGVPIQGGPAALFTRLDIVEQATAKREPPRTLDDLEAVAMNAVKPPHFYGIGWSLGRTPDSEGNAADIIRNDGGAKVNSDGTKPAILSDGTLAALTRMKRWWDEKLMPPDASSWDDTGNNNAYQSNRVAFIDNPPSVYDWLVSHDPGLLANTTMAPMPAGKAASFSGGAGGATWCVAAQSKARDLAIAFTDFLLQPDNLEIQCEQVGGRWFPAYQALADRPFWTSRPQFAYFPELMRNAVYDSYPAPPTPKLSAALGEASSSMVIADMVQAVIVNGTPIEKAVTDAQTTYEAIFKKHGLG